MGWNVVVGGCTGAIPSIAEVLAEDLSDDDAIALADKVINHYKASDTKQRLGRYIKKIGFEEFKKDLGV